jgi:hypothetical protein
VYDGFVSFHEIVEVFLTQLFFFVNSANPTLKFPNSGRYGGTFSDIVRQGQKFSLIDGLSHSIEVSAEFGKNWLDASHGAGLGKGTLHSINITTMNSRNNSFFLYIFGVVNW